MSVSLNGSAVVNHQLVYFDEIGFEQLTGLICDGHASEICCHDDHSMSSERSLPNGIGSWLYPSGSYVQRACDNDCDSVQTDTFQLKRTPNTTSLYRNKRNGVAGFMSGIYRCVVPLNLSDESEVLIHYVGIYEEGQGVHY